MIAPSEESQDRRPDGTLAGSAPAAAPASSTPAVSIPADGTDDPQVEGNAAERVIFFPRAAGGR